jgi:hypothetical protein
VNGIAESTTYTSSTQLTATVPAAQLASGGQLAVVVTNGSASSALGTPINLEVDNPVPTVFSSLTSSLPVGGPATVVTVTGSGFVPVTVIDVNGTARPTTYIDGGTVSVTITAADLAVAGTLALTAVNPAPGGGTSSASGLPVGAPTLTPRIFSVAPSTLSTAYSFYGSGTSITVGGDGFNESSVVEWNGKPLNTQSIFFASPSLTADVPLADLTTIGPVSITVYTPTALPAISNAVTINVTSANAPSLSAISPNAAPINTFTEVNLYGAGFTSASTVAVNGQTVPCVTDGWTQMGCNIPASVLALPGNATITVTNPGPGGGSASLPFTAYVPIRNNNIVYNPTDGLLYASVVVTGVGSGGNSVVGVDPATGAVMRHIQVGTSPNALALSTDGTQLFVGLDDAGAVVQVDLKKNAVVNQFSFVSGARDYNSPMVAYSLAAVPGSPNSVAVCSDGDTLSVPIITIYDSGVPRANSLSTNVSPLSFGPSSSILYAVVDGFINQLTVDGTGITGSVPLVALTYWNWGSFQYDNGKLYLGTGQVFDASTGAQLGAFPINTDGGTMYTFPGQFVSDSGLGRAFFVESGFDWGGQVLAYDESTFNNTESFPVNSIFSLSTSVFTWPQSKIVRWGQNGIAISTGVIDGLAGNQIYIFQSPVVNDLSASPADLSVSLAAPGTATTGQSISWVATVNNNGPNPAQGVSLAIGLDSSLIVNSVTSSQGTCGTGVYFTCDLSSLANNATATVTVNATPTTSGTLAGVASLSSVSYDPVTTNNLSTTSTIVSGSLYGAAPMISAISPNSVQAGSEDFTLTVTGAGFNEASTVNLGATALPTIYSSPIGLTALVSASQIANYGWAPVTVTNPAPGGGVSPALPLTIYAVVNVPASGLLFEPYTQQLYASISTTTITGNSVATIDPYTGTVGTPVPVGSGPNVMAETSDGNYLYIGLSGSNSLAQFDLLHQSLTATIPLSFQDGFGDTTIGARWLAAMPGSDTTLAVQTNDSWGDTGIFDISGATGAFRPNLGGGSGPVFPDASHLYTRGLSRYSVDANGLTLIDITDLNGFSNWLNGPMQLAGGLIYADAGGIINPATTPPSQVATLSTANLGGFTAADADPSLQKEFLTVYDFNYGAPVCGLARYDLITYLPEAFMLMPTSICDEGDAAMTMYRFGQDGLALLSVDTNVGLTPPPSVVMLLRGPFVTPQLLTASSAATLTSSSSSSIPHGSGNTLLTLTGSNLLPGVAVTWNGSYRTTTWVDGTHATVAIPASDLASAGTASLVATNPGASGSNTLQIPID